MNKHKYLMIDTETTNGLENPLIYDLGFSVIDNTGKVYYSFNTLISELYNDDDLMSTAYYANKRPIYDAMLANNQIKKLNFNFVYGLICYVIQKFNIRAIIAHNARFDYNALKNTYSYINNITVNKEIIPNNLPVWCTYTMALQLLSKSRKYKKFCTENNYLTKKYSRPQLTAEVLYRYITNNNDFVESHTALSDVLIEKEIFKYLIDRHKKCRRTYYKV